MTDAARVSVVMGTYNCAPYIEDTVASILQQTYADFEFIILDDTSSDGTWPKLEQLAAQDTRIVLQRNATNRGISATRNLGTELARGELIAIMDHDDISVPDRLEKQVAYLDAHPEVGAVGGAIQFLDGDTLSAPSEYPLTPGLIAWTLCFRTPSIHPASMVRRAALVAAGGYDPAYRIANDYDLWVRLSQQVGLANLPDVLLHYRRRSSSFSAQQPAAMYEEAADIARRVIEAEIGVPLSPDEVLHMKRGNRPQVQATAKLSRVLYHLAYHIRRKHHLTRAEWKAVRRDAALRTLRLAKVEPNPRRAAVAIAYAARLEPIYTARWLQSTLRKAAQRKLLMREAR